MENVSFFPVFCPHCSRASQLELHLLGRTTQCVHCAFVFEAKNADSTSAALDDPLHYWIHFTKHELLKSDAYLPDLKDVSRIPR